MSNKLHIFSSYTKNSQFFDEIFDENHNVREVYKTLHDRFKEKSTVDFDNLNKKAKASFLNQGITFQVYKEDQMKEQIFPFDLFPRIIPANEWEHIEKGVIQRNKALNLYLWDLYHDKNIINDGIVPMSLVESSANYLEQMKGFDPPEGVYNHICGTDLIKHSDGEYYVLEDNIRCPSGVSYVVGNRTALKRALFGIFNHHSAHSVSSYSENLLEIMESVKPNGVDIPCCVVLTPGVYNSAYYEHSFLAKSMGVELVEGRDLFVENDFLYMKTIKGPERVDVVYRRIDDNFLDPEEFNKNSVLGVGGLMSAYLKGNVTLVNAPGTGVADDKAIYTYMPKIIKYYLDEEPILKNVKTYHCSDKEDRDFVIKNIANLVIKPVDESGGYGVLIGSKLTQNEINEAINDINATPRKYIAQPIMSLSTHATYIEEDGCFSPRHVDLRTYTLLGKDKSYVLKGGLTRVALQKGNLIVNSSQGGGSKDTWVLKK